MWINRIKWRDGKTNVRDTKTDEEIIKMVYIIPNSKTVDTCHILFHCVNPAFHYKFTYLVPLREIKTCNLK